MTIWRPASTGSGPTREEFNQYVRLQSRAPDLLAALKELEEALPVRMPGNTLDEAQRLVAAIARARALIAAIEGEGWHSVSRRDIEWEIDVGLRPDSDSSASVPAGSP